MILDNKLASEYPVLMSANVRSRFPKIDSFCSTLIEEAVDICFVSELWMVNNNPLHIRELERRSNLCGIDFICNARVARRGGGVAVVVNKARSFSSISLLGDRSTGYGIEGGVY